MIYSPHPFSERLLCFGDGGAGKTEAALNVAHHTQAPMWFIESDLSAAAERIIHLDYPDIVDNVSIYPVDGWEELLEAMTEVINEQADPENDWVVIDSASPISYEWAQEWAIDEIYGDALSNVLINARKHFKRESDFKGAKLELGQWDLVKKEYRKFWRLIQRWKGHMILTAESKSIGYWDKDDKEVHNIYGFLGEYPDGQRKIRHAMGTTLFLEHPKVDTWQMTTVKDRGKTREALTREAFDEFALEYLVMTAGWKKGKNK